MKVALFVPCYVDQLFPRVAWATARLLERLGCSVAFDAAQTCCGQPLLTAGHPAGARPLAQRFLEIFADAEHVVAPSASCVATVRRHYEHLLPEAPGVAAQGGRLGRPTRSPQGREAAAQRGEAERSVGPREGSQASAGAPLHGLERVRELCEFVVEVLGVERIAGRYPHRVGLHPSCHGLRELRLGSASECATPHRDPARLLLGSLDGIALVEPARPDECCGFGGVFAVSESAVSGMMGRDRVRALRAAGAEVLTSTDVSCLAHLDGVARRAGEPLRVAHVAEILDEASA